jgi:hypothetical protein
MNSENTKLTLDINGTFEVAIARNRLRKAASQHDLPLMLQARATAALTSITEVVLFQSGGKNRDLKLVVLVHSHPDQQGVEFQFFALLHNETIKEGAMPEQILPYGHDELGMGQSRPIKQATDAEGQFAKVCDELNISQHGSFDHVIMRLWTWR